MDRSGLRAGWVCLESEQKCESFHLGKKKVRAPLGILFFFFFFFSRFNAALAGSHSELFFALRL